MTTATQTANMIKTLTLGLGALLLTAGATQAQARGRSGPAYVRMRSINYAGTGCPAGSVAESISSDAAALTLSWDSFVAEVGPGLPLSSGRANCQLNIDLEYPSGWSYAVVGASSRGYVQLDQGVTATHAFSLYFQGQAATAHISTDFHGPVARDYEIKDQLVLSEQVWSPCGLQRSLKRQRLGPPRQRQRQRPRPD